MRCAAQTLSISRSTARSALDSSGDADPAHYDDRRFITALWTKNGRDVTALVHHEYHADAARPLLRHRVDRLLAQHDPVLLIATTAAQELRQRTIPLSSPRRPSPTDVEQGRHRGFFNPSNIVSDGRYAYMFASTTGWTGQPRRSVSVPHARSRNAPTRGERSTAAAFSACAIEDPLPPDARRLRRRVARRSRRSICPSGTVVRQRASGLWIAVWMATRDDREIPVSGFYYASSADLMSWTAATPLARRRDDPPDRLRGNRDRLPLPH